uniref:Uncharacterized protein n=1 Tax=viral metagenome TaxID=1070528 RepID=A0A6M3KZ06_9ZZZZ
MVSTKWKKVGMGIAAATIGAAAFGAVHFMFLAPQFGVGDFLGIPLNVVLPFLLGGLGLVAAYSFKMGETVQDIVKYGSAAIIGVGVGQYAGWIAPAAPAARARASLPVARASFPMRTATAPVITMNGTKLI